MKRNFVFCVLFLLTNSIYGQTESFYQKVLDDFDCRNCYFLAIDVKTKDYSGKIVVENDELFNYLKQSKGLKKESEYKKFMLKLFTEKKKLYMDSVKLDADPDFLVGKDISKYSFRTIRDSSPRVRL